MPFRHSKHPKHDQNRKNNRKIPNFLPDVHELASWRWKRGRKTPLIKPYLITYQWGKDEERRRQCQSLMSSCKKSLAHEYAISNVRCHFVIQNTPNMTKMERITEKYLISYRTFMNSLVEDEREGEKHLWSNHILSHINGGKMKKGEGNVKA